MIQSKKDNANIYVRYSIDRKTNLKRKTGFIINPKDWSEDKAHPKQGRDDLKALKLKLDKLAVFINDAYNDDVSKGVVFTGEWLQYQIDLFNNKIIVVDLDVLANSIDEYLKKRQDLTSRVSLRAQHEQRTLAVVRSAYFTRFINSLSLSLYSVFP